MRLLGKLGLLAGLIAALATGPAVAETNFPVIGGPGNGGFEDRCPAGQYMIAVAGRAGAWVDQIQLMCTGVTVSHDRDGSFSYYLASDFDHWYRGPPRGGSGGVATGAECRAPIISAQVAMTPGNRQVKYVDFSCIELATDAGAYTSRLNHYTDPASDVNGGASRPSLQQCPTGEVAIGIRGRYGQDLNALALICGAFNPGPYVRPEDRDASQAPAPPAKPVHVTGALPGQPAPTATPRPASTFNGAWTVTAGGARFTLQLMLVQGATMGGVISDSNPADKGALRGVLQDATHAQFIVARDTLGRSGTLNVLLDADGNSFNADGVLGGVFVTWRASRTSAPN